MPKEIVPEKRTCKICGKDKPLADFFFQKKLSKAGEKLRVHQCRACLNERKMRQFREKHPLKDRRKPVPAEMSCKVCGETRVAAEFIQHKRKSSSGEAYWFPRQPCRFCHNAKLRVVVDKRKRPSHKRCPVDKPKRCSMCGEVKDPSCYRINKARASGRETLHSWCEPCRLQRARDDRKRRIIEVREYARKFRAARRQENREEERRKAREYGQKNKDRIREKKRKQREDNREAARLRARAGAHNRRARERGQSLTGKPKGEYLKAMTAALESYRVGDLYWDVYDSRLISSPTVDHVIPFAGGGTNSEDNLAVTSLSNNSSKNQIPLLIWMARRAEQYRKENGDNARRYRKGSALDSA